MKKMIVLVALAVAACGSPQQTASNYPQPGCDPQVSNCYGTGVGRDSHGDAILAGVAGAGLGYAAGRMANRNNDRHYDNRSRDYDRNGYRSRDYDRSRPRTTIVNNHYGAAPVAATPYRAPAASSYSAPVRSTPSYSAPARSTPISRPASRTMFHSARSYRR